MHQNVFFILLVSIPFNDYTPVCLANKAAMDVLYKSLGGNAFITLGYIPRSGIAGPEGKCMFNFVRNSQSFSQSA